jgi:hypothetical protein
VSYRYFAYGATLDAEHVNSWCRDHGYAEGLLAEGMVAILDDYELLVEVPSRRWLGGVGTISIAPGASVYGVLFELDDERADIVRHKEGVASGLFQEIDVEVRLWTPGADPGETTIQLLPARSFRASDARQGRAAPSKGWLDTVVRGAQAHELPDMWVAELRRRARG